MHYLAIEIYELWRDANHGGAPSWLSLPFSEQDKWSRFAQSIEERFRVPDGEC